MPGKVKKQTKYKEIAAFLHGVACDEGSNKPKYLRNQSDAMGMGKSTVLSFLVFQLCICFQHIQLTLDGWICSREARGASVLNEAHLIFAGSTTKWSTSRSWPRMDAFTSLRAGCSKPLRWDIFILDFRFFTPAAALSVNTLTLACIYSIPPEQCKGKLWPFLFILHLQCLSSLDLRCRNKLILS